MKNFQKGFVAPLLILVIALIVGGGVYVYKNKKAKMAVSINDTTNQKKTGSEY